MSAAGVRITLIVLGSGDTPEGGGAESPDVRVGRPDIAALLPDVPLAEAGDRRFVARSGGFQLSLGTRGADDVLWEAVLDGLGYARNRKGFRQLAARMPWTRIASACAGIRVVPADLELLLLWAAGMGARPRDGSIAGTIAGALEPLEGTRPEWASAAGRPRNHPARRIRAASNLAVRWLASGGPASHLEPAVLAATGPRQLDLALVAASSGNEDGSRLGAGRAGAIVVNAVLPCVHAIALGAGRWHVAEKCLALYRRHAKLPENGVERAARSLLSAAGRPFAARGARDQQGLIYMYRSLASLATR